MKNSFLFFFFFPLLGFTQDCPVINFTYDAAGNRISRQPGTITCGPARKSNPAKTDSLTMLAAKVYPNPTQDKLTVELEKTAYPSANAVSVATILLYDLSGRKIYSETTGSDKLQIDMSGFSAGTYLLKIVRGKDHTEFTISKN